MGHCQADFTKKEPPWRSRISTRCLKSGCGRFRANPPLCRFQSRRMDVMGEKRRRQTPCTLIVTGRIGGLEEVWSSARDLPDPGRSDTLASIGLGYPAPAGMNRNL